MKKRKSIALLLATVMTLSAVPANAFASNDSVEDIAASDSVVESVDETVESGSALVGQATAGAEDGTLEAEDGWVSGWTGTGSSGFSVTGTDTSAVLKITKSGNGKISDGEDSFAYYATEVSLDSDFTLKGNVTIDAYNTLGSSNPHQSSFGIMAVDELHSKAANANDLYRNSLMLMSYMSGSTATEAGFRATARNSAAKKSVIDQYTTPLAISGSNLGTHAMEITKSGSAYALTLDGETVSYVSSDIFTDNAYVGFYVARDAAITVSDISLDVVTKKISSLTIESMPTRTQYALNSAVDLTGLKLVANYDDGTSGEITDYVVTNFDTSTKGDKVMTLVAGNASVDIAYSVDALKCIGVAVDYAPVVVDYYEGKRFNSTGIEVSANYNDGTSEALESDDYTLYLGDKAIDDTYYFTESDFGTQAIKVIRNSSDVIDGNDAYGTFNINVHEYSFSGIDVLSPPATTVYYLGDELSTAGINVAGVYKNAEGGMKYSSLATDEFTVSGFDSTTSGSKVITVTSVQNPKFTAVFTVKVEEKAALGLVLTKYPRTTYQVGDKFDKSEMVVSEQYSNGDEVVVAEDEEYTIDTSKFDSSKVGETYVVIKPTNPLFVETVVNITITDEKVNYWGSAFFGQSTSTSKMGVVPSSSVKTAGAADSVKIYANSGAGKITGDHDGIAYYYTRANADNNFTVAAKITVNSYLSDNIDENRSGQEAFGIMARDVIPLTPNDEFTGDIAVKTEDAKLDEFGEPIPLRTSTVFASNIALAGGYSGTGWPTDPTALSYEKNTKINRINLYMRTGVYGYDKGGTKNGPYKISDTFPKNGNVYYVTLKKINNGMYASCYDYQTGETKETYQYPDMDGFLNYQNEDSIYVGFFAARYANITVEDIEYYESDPSTDPYTTVATEEQVAPAISVTSNLYTNLSTYPLVIKPSNEMGGLVTIKCNDEVAYYDATILKRASTFNLKLKENQENVVTILYTPNAGDNITSTDTIMQRVTVVQRATPNNDEVIYASPTGSSTGAGTLEDPWDVYTAIGFVGLGQKIVCLEGTYKLNRAIEVSASHDGTAVAKKYLFAEEGKDVIFDSQDLYAGMVLEGDYWHVKGIDFVNSADNQKPFHLAGSNCIIEDCKFYNNGDTGFQISRNDASKNTIDEWPANNLVLNCEAYNNCDPSKINADGFGCKLTVGVGNIFRNCVSHHNLDDGWDMYTKLASGAIGAATLENCVSYRQGYKLNEDGSETSFSAGGNNGFKLGGENVPVQHYLKNCVAYSNSNGVTSNSNPQLKIRGMVSYANSGSNYSLYSNSTGRDSYNYDLMYCVSYKGGSKDVLGTYTRDTDYTNAASVAIDNDTNYWSGKGITDSFFKSLSRDSSMVNYKYQQDTDGNFIFGDFLARADGFVYVEPTVEPTTDATTEATTKAKSSGGSGGGASYVIVGTTSTTTTTVAEEDTEATTSTEVEEDTEATTIAVSENMFDDIDGNFAADYINKLAEDGIINGVGNNKFAPQEKVKRADFVLMLVNALGLENTEDVELAFTDVKSSDYFYNAVKTAYALGIIKGVSATEFGATSYITRQDVMVIVDKALGLEDDASYTLDNFTDKDKISDYAYASVNRLVGAGIISGNNGKINPKDGLTRAEAAVIIGKLVYGE